MTTDTGNTDIDALLNEVISIDMGRYEVIDAKAAIRAAITKKLNEARIEELAKFGYATFKFVIPEDGLRYDHIDPYITEHIKALQEEETNDTK